MRVEMCPTAPGCGGAWVRRKCARTFDGGHYDWPPCPSPMFWCHCFGDVIKGSLTILRAMLVVTIKYRLAVSLHPLSVDASPCIEPLCANTINEANWPITNVSNIRTYSNSPYYSGPKRVYLAYSDWITKTQIKINPVHNPYFEINYLNMHCICILCSIFWKGLF